jgi:hypothetical protein
MRRLAVAALFAFCLPLAAQAKTYAIPSSDAIATVTLPDSWDADELDDGVEVTSNDETVYAAIEAVDLLDVKAATVEAIKFFDEKGIKIDASTQKETDFEVNGMKAFELGWKGKDHDGDTTVSITVIGVSEKKMLMITFWGSEEGQSANIEGLKKIISSIQATKK